MLERFVHVNKDHIAWKLLFIILYLVIIFSLLITLGNVFSNSRLEDFTSFYAAAQLVFEDSLSPYTHQNWEIAASKFPSPLWAFLSPPPSLFLFRFFNLFTYEAAESAMIVLNLGFIIAFALLLLVKHLRLPIFYAGSVIFLAYIFTFEPLKQTMDYGQVNIIVLFLISTSWYLLKRKPDLHPLLIALPLSVAAILKLYPLLLFVYLFFRKKRRVVLWGIGILLLSIVISLLTLPNETWPDWIMNISNQGYGAWVRGIDPSGLANQSINGFTARLFLGRQGFVDPFIPSPVAARVAPLLISGTLVLVIIVSLMLTEEPDEGIDLEISLFLVTMFLVAPLSWEHHLVFVLPGVIVVLHQAFRTNRRHLSLLVLVPIAIVLTLPIDYSDSFYRLSFKHSLLISSKFYAVVSLWLFIFLKRFFPTTISRSDTRKESNEEIPETA